MKKRTNQRTNQRNKPTREGTTCKRSAERENTVHRSSAACFFVAGCCACVFACVVRVLCVCALCVCFCLRACVCLRAPLCSWLCVCVVCFVRARSSLSFQQLHNATLPTRGSDEDGARIGGTAGDNGFLALIFDEIREVHPNRQP